MVKMLHRVGIKVLFLYIFGTNKRGEERRRGKKRGEGRREEKREEEGRRGKKTGESERRKRRKMK
jgi:hypothetical protein